jgi:PIN domain nuclease of toxin-antitoxin system
MQSVLLDTQAFYIAATDGVAALPKKVYALLMDDDVEGCISATTIMEIAIKHGVGKIGLDDKLTRQGIADLRLRVLPFDEQHAYRLFTLPPHHRDPFDRMIIATALAEGIPLIGADREFRKYKGLKVIW